MFDGLLMYAASRGIAVGAWSMIGAILGFVAGAVIFGTSVGEKIGRFLAVAGFVVLALIGGAVVVLAFVH